MVAKEGFETVGYPTEEKTTEIFRSMRHLNNKHFQKKTLIKKTLTINPKRLQGKPPPPKFS